MSYKVRYNQVRARAPLRLGLGGGGTDLSAYSDDFGGVVLNATIDRYAFAHLQLRDDHQVAMRADDIGKAEVLPLTLDFSVREGLSLHRAVYRHFMMRYNNGEPMALTIITTNDVPAGSGLGASSALVVALIEAFSVLFDVPLGPYEVAQLAFEIERVELGLQGGKQDQYAAAFGGLNFIEFLKGSSRVIVNPLRMRSDYVNEFESSLVICFSGQSRESADIIAQQVVGIEKMSDATLKAMHGMKQSAEEMKSMLLSGDLHGVADQLLRSWKNKKITASAVSNLIVDKLLEVGLEAGAWAGKVSGAGGGGFIMLMTDPANRYAVIRALNAAGGKASAVKLTFNGVEGWAVPCLANRRG
jgi:D-glycero-alpha-D-manno-heptose-7-phosphate kinase